MAARVVGSSAPAPAIATAVDAGENRAAVPLRRSDQPNTDDLTPDPAPEGQTDFELPTTQDVSADTLTPDDVTELESGEPTPTGGALSLSRDSATVGRMGGDAPADVANLVAHPGPGRPLPSGLRARVEPHFGTSFKDVRLHTTAADQKAATRIGARAFTHRNHIWLGPGESETNTRLMAHELTHVVQQTRGKDSLPINRTEAPTIHRESWTKRKLEGYARHVPGYTLITVIVGRKLISGAKVERNAVNLLEGIFGLIPGALLLFDKLRQARAVEDAYKWVVAQLTDLNLTWSRIKSTLKELWDGLISWSPIENAKRILGKLIRDVLTFAKRVATKILEFIVRGALKLAGPYGEKVWGVLKQAGDVIGLILKDPLGFAINLMRSIVGGFRQFGRNVLKHLKAGVLGWLFGSLTKSGITMPERLDFRGLMSLVMQMLGLTYANFRAQLVKQLGPSGERKIVLIEKSVEIVKILLNEGFAGIWQKMLEITENFKETFIGGMISMVTTTIVQASISLLAGLSNPIGAVVKVCLTIYKLIVTFIERLDQIMDVAKSIFSSIGAIARGQIQFAKDFIEQTIGRTVPVVIAFLAAAFGIGGIPAKIRGVFDKMRGLVTKGMVKLIKFVIKKTKKLFSKLISKLNGKRKLPSADFKIGKEKHRIFAESRDKKRVQIMVASQKATVEAVVAANAAETKKLDSKKPDGASKNVSKNIHATSKTAQNDTTDNENKIDLASEKENQLKHLKDLETELADLSKKLNASGKGIEQAAYIDADTTSSPRLYRVIDPRDEVFEGKAGLYKDLKAEASSPVLDRKGGPPKSIKRSQIYELDHIIEKQFAKTILKNLDQLDSRNVNASADNVQGVSKDDNKGKKNRSATTVYRTIFKDKAGKNRTPTAIGQLGGSRATDREKLNAETTRKKVRKAIKLDKLGESGSDLPAVAVYYRNHRKDKVATSPTDIIKAAVTKGGSTQDRHKTVAIALAAQLNHEIDAVSAQMDKDRTSDTILRKNVAAGLNKARDSNAAIFDLDIATLDTATAKTDAEKTREAQQGDPKATDWRTAGGQPKYGPTDAPMQGAPGHPNFAAIEGVGVPYNSGAMSKDGYLESDHVIDKIYPLTAQKAAIVADVKAVKAAALKQRDSGRFTKDQSTRLKQLSENLFPATTGMGKYTANNGYAIPIQQTLASRVTSRTSKRASDVNSVITQSRALTFDDQVKFVLDGTPDLATLRGKIAGPVQDAFVTQTEDHETAISDEYRKDLRDVPASHPAELRTDAQRHMLRIVGQVSTSLGKANRKTRALF